MNFKLVIGALLKFLFGVALVGALVFLPAGGFNYFGGWLLMGVLFLPMIPAGVLLMIKNPKLLERRLSAKEKQREQSAVVKLSGLMFIIGFVLAGLGHRFGWFALPSLAQIIAAAVFVLGYILYAEVMRENAYLSRTIKVEDGQTLVDTGLYGVVRHPMYLATLILFLAMPIILGSLYSLIVFMAYPFIIAARIVNEERLLEDELSGYTEYKKRVKYRLIPFIW